MIGNRLAETAAIFAPLEIADTLAVDLSASVDVHAAAEAAIGLAHNGEPSLVLTFLSMLTHAPRRALATFRATSGIVHPSQNSRKKALRSGHSDGKPLILNELVPKKGLEPPHPCEYVDLNHARLPIPPLRHGHMLSEAR